MYANTDRRQEKRRGLLLAPLRGREGVTLIELVTVLVIVGILVLALGFSFTGWRGRYRVESQLKTLQTDLLEMQALALQRNRAHFITFATGGYLIYEDTSPSPSGDQTLTVGNDELVNEGELDSDYELGWSASGGTEIFFNGQGIISADKTLCIYELDESNNKVETQADMNCIEILKTRVSIGRMSDSTGSCTAANCEESG